jgi:uncharacterized protein (UPF0335 family)
MDVLDKLDSVELKIRQLVQKMERLEGENAELEAENKRLKTELDKQNGAVRTLKNKLEKSQQIMAVPDGGEPTGRVELVKEQINQYIEEIDKCIEWLHKS